MNKTKQLATRDLKENKREINRVKGLVSSRAPGDLMRFYYNRYLVVLENLNRTLRAVV